MCSVFVQSSQEANGQTYAEKIILHNKFHPSSHLHSDGTRFTAYIFFFYYLKKLHAGNVSSFLKKHCKIKKMTPTFPKQYNFGLAHCKCIYTNRI